MISSNGRLWLLCVLAVLWNVCSNGLSVIASENPFGLPEPEDPSKPGSVMLHGGGHGVRDYIREEFLKLAGGPHARIVFLPSDEEQWNQDSQSFEAYEKRLASLVVYGHWIELCAENQAQFEFLHWNSPHDPNHARFYQSLEQATGVWLTAGDQAWLTKRFADDPLKPTRFQLALRKIVSRGGIVGGLGGGMASLAETVIAGDADETEFGWNTARLEFGLGLLQGALTDQNFDRWSGRLERLTDALRNGPRLDRVDRKPGIERRSVGLGVDRHTAAIVTGNQLRVIGEGKADLFIKSNGDRTITWHRLKPGDPPITLKVASTNSISAAVSPDKTELKSPFGAPDPQHPDRPGTVVLHGGGTTAEMYDLFPTLSRKVSPLLVHCPSASTAYQDLKNEDLQKSDLADVWNTRALGALSFINPGDRREAENQAILKVLAKADALWFMGGDQERLSSLFVNPIQPTRFQQEVFALVRRGGVVGGSSAGCAAMSDVMIGGTLQENDDEPAEAQLSRGLGVLSNVVAEQHFDARRGRIERFSQLMRDQVRLANVSPGCNPGRMIGIAVEEDTALIIRHNRVRVVGRKKAHLFLRTAFRDTLVWHALEAGDIGIVVPAKDGAFQFDYEEWSASN